MSFQRFGFTGLLRRFQATAIRYGERLRSGLIRLGEQLPISEPGFELGAFLTRIRRELVARGLPEQLTTFGRFLHVLETGDLRIITLHQDELLTYHILLVGPDGRSLTIAVRGPFGRPFTEDELLKAIRSAVWDLEGENVFGSGYRPTEWVRLARAVTVSYRTTFVRA